MVTLRVIEGERVREREEKKSLISSHASERYYAKYIKLLMKTLHTGISIYIFVLN